jgi:hypothetical protein
MAGAALAGFICWCGAGAAQETIHIEIEAEPIASAGEAPAAAVVPRVVVAPISDTTGMFPLLADRELLDSALRTAISERKEIGVEVVELPAALEPCDRSCEASRARLNEARYLVVAEIRLFAGAYVAIIEIIQTADARTIHTFQTDAVDAPPALLAAIKASSARTAAELGEIVNPSPADAARPTKAPAPRGASFAAAGSAWTAGNPAAVETYRSRRNAGVAVFVIGILLQVAGGALWGVGEATADEALYYSGIGTAAFGTLLFWCGLAGWITNQVRMNKAERGLPLGRSLRLEGLAPIVASPDRGAMGLSATFSF